MLSVSVYQIFVPRQNNKEPEEWKANQKGSRDPLEDFYCSLDMVNVPNSWVQSVSVHPEVSIMYIVVWRPSQGIKGP